MNETGRSGGEAGGGGRPVTSAVRTEGDARDLLAGRPVLVTGADGFVGSHLTETLLEYGARVHAFVRATSSGLLHNIVGIKNRIVVHRGDLTDKQAVSMALRSLKADGGRPIIFHLGAQAHVGESWARPYETLASNALGTMNVLQTIVDLDLDLYRIDAAGSSEEYGNVLEEVQALYRFDPQGGLILDERSPLNPQSVYAASKVATDFLTRSYQRAYGIPAVVTRMFNNYGPRQNPRFVTGTVITQALSRDTIELGYVKSKRDFCFVRDGVQGHLHATLWGEPGEVYVYGSGSAISIADWYEMIIRIGREEGYWGERHLGAFSGERTRHGKSEVNELRVDFSKLRRVSGWEPRYTWEQGLRETIRWYAENRDRWVGRVDWR
jgi:dTDP-glucose 4,6-dehydratase